ncbi:hypothetical protein HW115_16210 [Verrucomicrobiaceae bacterium N1E253]|uniref:Uncharacterized protein n=1 Tax=Oceaniferula marina TaxID=2748318 RepID=A0A851GQ91_9BACT|nr:hypothetical protein [Oceaniferula marina]NWK57167.1 hypothetical protein [Oceaniferula marina]
MADQKQSDRPKKAEAQSPAKVRKGGFFKRLLLLGLFLVMAYLGFHVYFIWQPVGKPEKFNQQVMDLELSGVKVFPAIKSYDVDEIDGRRELLNGTRLPVSPLPQRLKTAIERNEPVSFHEREVNAWLRKRLQVKQGGLLEKELSVVGTWVNFKPGEIEFAIERELPKGIRHVTSIFMRFEPIDNGFSIHRHASQVGQVKLPGGFARLVMPAFSAMAEELAEELKLYRDESKGAEKALQIHDVVVEHGRITLDPRLSNQPAR